MTARESVELVDVLIVGAGLSGIGAAYHLQTRCPGKTYAILEARSSLGGTWDLFRYPGIRSDSDMYTLGYSFKPWLDKQAIASGAAILQYVRDTARENGIEPKIRFNRRMLRADWSTSDACWTVEIAGPGEDTSKIRCNMLYACTGYYDYASGYTPEFPGVERFEGQLVHPQRWTSDVDYAGKRVVVIGSGATAVTLVPELARSAAHVTMLQRSPTYVISRPQVDYLADLLRRVLPAQSAYALTRWKNVLLSMAFYQLSKRKPEWVARLLFADVKRRIGSKYASQHFRPTYKPWDQRLCLVPNGDLFRTIASRRASVVTDHIESFTPHGIKLRSGAELEADLIVTATGLKLQAFGGASISVDGVPVALSQALMYKGMMLSDVPNLVQAGGYTNASWTLKCDLTAEYTCRLLRHCDSTGQRQFTARNHDPSIEQLPMLDFSSSYVLRSIAELPKQGSKVPWRVYQNYVRDLLALRYGKIDDGVMEFSNARPSYGEDVHVSSLPPRRPGLQDDREQASL